MATEKENPCLNCSVKNMFHWGCCTHYAPDGVGFKKIRAGLQVYLVCRNLVVGDGPPYCGDYMERDDRCRSFDCGLALLHRSKRV